MKIGMNARFLRKQGTGIGQVTKEFLRTLSLSKEMEKHELFLYVEELPVLDFALPSHWHFRVISSWYGRDDLIREHLWETTTLPRAVQHDQCAVFFSLYQSATVLPETIKHIMLVHDLIPLRYPLYLGNWRKRWHYRSVQKAIRRATQVVTPSQATLTDLVEQLGLARKKIQIIPLGRSSLFEKRPAGGAMRAILEKYRLTPGYIYHGGGLEIRKNTKRLLQAYAELKRKDRAVPPLVISGMVHSSKNPVAENIPAVVAELKLEKEVRILGFVPETDLPSLYAGALYFVYPSLFEGFGLPLLEALTLGIPALTSKTSSLPEVAGEAALYCDPESASSIEAGMERLWREPELRASLSELGKTRSEEFSWERFCAKIVPLLVK